MHRIFSLSGIFTIRSDSPDTHTSPIAQKQILSSGKWFGRGILLILFAFLLIFIFQRVSKPTVSNPVQSLSVDFWTKFQQVLRKWPQISLSWHLLVQQYPNLPIFAPIIGMALFLMILLGLRKMIPKPSKIDFSNLNQKETPSIPSRSTRRTPLSKRK